MPINFYQIQTKFRDEIRPRFGLMRGREFIMKDAYSFDVDSAAADLSYDKMYQAYNRIFERCGLNFRAVEADTGSIGGSASHEFMVLASSGEDAIVSCSACRYAANVEKAEGIRQQKGGAGVQVLTKVHTPDKKTITEVSEFLGLSLSSTVKSLVLSSGDGKFVMALVRGDHELNELKLKNHLGWDEIQMATDDDILRFTGSPPGFLGPVGLKEELSVVADYTIESMLDLVIGANETDQHFTGANVGRDFNISQFADIRLIGVNDPCPRCTDGVLEVWRGIEVGHVFKLGTKYSSTMNALYLDKDGKEQTIFMGCYGIGIGRTVAASIEQNHDTNGVIWPLPLAPFHCSVVAINAQKDDAVMAVAQDIHDRLESAGIEVLLDDRDERPGVKFKDHDLIGIPLRIVVGGKNLADGKVEYKLRAGGDMQLLVPEQAIENVIAAVRTACGGLR
jgi:prolyl-tRNA synthetase